MQIYGILLNIRGKSWKICGKSFHFFPFHSSNSSQMTRFRGRFRSFSVVFAVISGENQRISEKIREFLQKNGEYRGKSFLFIPFLSTSLHFIPFYSSNPRFSSPNVKFYKA